MRIIAGTHRGRPILSPTGEQTRPIIDRVKQSLFDRLASAYVLDEAVVLDLFAGTGSLGLECLSRGAAHVTFVEQDRPTCDLLRKNLEALKESDKSLVLPVNVLSLGGSAALRRSDYSLVFLDPPYALVRDEAQAQKLWTKAAALAEACGQEAMLILRIETVHAPPPITGWSDPQSHRYGTMTLHLYPISR